MRRILRRNSGIGNGVKTLKRRWVYSKKKTNTEPEERLDSGNTKKGSALGVVFSNLDDSSSLEKSGLDASFFKKEKLEEVISESETNLPAPIV